MAWITFYLPLFAVGGGISPDRDWRARCIGPCHCIWQVTIREGGREFVLYGRDARRCNWKYL